MSFSFSFTAASADDANAQIDALASNVPQQARDYAKAGVAALNLGSRTVEVAGYGHLHDGTVGDSETTSLNVSVTPK